jgi:hypothetical protein
MKSTRYTVVARVFVRRTVEAKESNPVSAGGAATEWRGLSEV